ncbi:NAD-P-binding protein [Mycena belliarum]|uniref:NAD-P-binding protein n=1 Tax=Mycena belliarum TaxID=1033014 RepID=A0AAD6XHK3_9AGAR|nr:NAD-P-binding protein [Mycena belliae]
MREYRLHEFQGFESLKLTEAPTPTPGPGQVLVKVHAVSLQYRDLMVVKGNYPTPLQPGVVPVSDMAGEIIAVGANVTSMAVGDRVCADLTMPGHIFGDLGADIDGVLCEFKVLDASRLVKFPAHLTYLEACTLPCAGLTAYLALYGHTSVKRGDVVLVQGTSGVSIFALQFALAAGASVIITSSSDAKLEVARKLGASHGINYKTTPNWEDEVLKLTDGQGADIVVDIGGASSVVQSVKACRFGGCVHVVGVLGAPSPDLGTLPILLITKSACVRGVLLHDGMQPFCEMNAMIDAAKLRLYMDPKTFAFEDAPAAFRYLESQAHVGKVVIRVSEDCQ